MSVGGVTLAAHRPHRRPGISFHSSDHPLARCLGAADERSPGTYPPALGIELEVSVTGSIPRHTSTGRVSGDARHERKRPRQLRHIRRNRDRGRHLRTRLFPPTHRTHNPLPRGPRTQKSLHTIYATPKKCDTSRRDMSGIDNENIALTVARRTSECDKNFDQPANLMCETSARNSVHPPLARRPTARRSDDPER